MNGLLKKILINVLVFIFLFLLFDFFVYQIMSYKEGNDKQYPFNYLSAYTYFPIRDFRLWFDEYSKYSLDRNYDIPNNKRLKSNIRFRGVNYRNNDKSPILMLGCSFTWGADLDPDDTISSQLSKYSNRSVYNFAMPGWGIQQSLYLLENALIEKLDIKPEYVIYTFIPDHLRRSVSPCSFFENSFVFYEEENEKLVLKKDIDILYWHTYISRFLYIKSIQDVLDLNMPKYINFYLKHLLAVNKQIKHYSPNSTFVVFVYKDDDILVEIQPELEKNGIKVIFLEKISSIDISARENLNDDLAHPSAKVWKEVAPLLVKELNL